VSNINDILRYLREEYVSIDDLYREDSVAVDAKKSVQHQSLDAKEQQLTSIQEAMIENDPVQSIQVHDKSQGSI